MFKAPENVLTEERKTQLIALRVQRLTRTAIATEMGVSLSQVKRWLIATKAPLPRSPGADPQVAVTPSTPYSDPEEDLSLMERCKLVLGDRMGEDRHRGYLLDKVHVSSNDILKAAKQAGLVFEPTRKYA